MKILTTIKFTCVLVLFLGLSTGNSFAQVNADTDLDGIDYAETVNTITVLPQKTEAIRCSFSRLDFNKRQNNLTINNFQQLIVVLFDIYNIFKYIMIMPIFSFFTLRIYTHTL